MMNQAERRRQVLLAWAYLQRQDGQLIPTNDELSHIAMTRAIPPGLRTPVVTRWAHVLHHLMWLSDQGHPDPVSDARRMAPAGPPIPAPGPPVRPANPPVQPMQPVEPVQQVQRPEPDADQPSERTQQMLDELNREIEAATEAARQAIAEGREPGPHLIRRNSLRDRLARVARGATPEPVATSPEPVEGPEPVATSHEPVEGPEPVATSPEPVEGPEPFQGRPTESREPFDTLRKPRPFDTLREPFDTLREPFDTLREHTDPATLSPVQRLMVWRDQGGHQELKDRHIRQIVNSGAHTTSEVAAGLPASLKSLAPAIAEELGLSQPGTESEQSARSDAAGTEPSGRSDHAHASVVDTEPAPLNPKAVSWQQPDRLAQELLRFAAMDFTQPPGQPSPIKVAPRADGSLTLRWPATDDDEKVTIYRVVSDDDHVPYSPEVSEVIGITAETIFSDTRPFSSAVRHYQVWMNHGPTMAEALLEQPTLHAEVPVVAKPVGVDIREDEGRVVGQWTLRGEARRVQIFRVPAERAGVGAGNPLHRICADRPNLTGFVDADAEPGRRYLYQLLVEAEVAGSTQLSLPTVVPVTTTARLSAVSDLVCALHEGGGPPRFNLEWTMPPQGRVVIYRAAAAPLAGAEADTVDESALPQMNLRPEARLNYPSEVVAGRATVRDVPWPRDWHRTYFTPVTLHDGRARVGRTASAVHVGTPGDPRIVERVSEQVLTMQWPSGADTIKVYASPPGGSAEEAVAAGSAIAEISREKYERLGGLHFSTPLDSHGCSLHLLPIAFSGGKAVPGKPATVAYRGLLTLHYGIEVRRTGAMSRGRVLLIIRIRANQPNPSSPPFALVNHPHRLPLDVGDGEQLPVQWNVERADRPVHRFGPRSLAPAWSDPGWVADVTGRIGWVRVFIDFKLGPEHGTVALLDPPVSQLFLGGR